MTNPDTRRGGRGTARLAVGLVALALAACGRSERTTPAARALLLITVDTWRADAFGAGGNPVVRTPAIDRFFRGSVQFSEAYSPVPTTLASHVSLLTGAWPTRHGVPGNLWPVPDDLVTLAEILSERGFETAAFLSSAALAKDFNLGQGFETYNFKPVAYARNDAPWRPAARTLHRSLTWWGKTDGPRFLWTHLWEPHFPYEPDPRLARLYDPEYDGPADGSMDYLMKLWKRREPPPRADRDHVVALYHAEITGLDRVLGQFLEIANTDEAVVVLTSDHGESLGEHDLSFKHGPHVFPGDVRVPLAVRAPGLSPGVSAALVRTIDVPRTVLDLLGVDRVELPEEAGDLLDWADGGEGLPVFGVATQPWEMMETDVYPCTPLQRVVRTPRAAYVETPFRQRRAWYNRATDPGELRGMSVDGSALADSLRTELDRWIENARYRSDYRPVKDERLIDQLKSLGYVE
jgi:arylsulfatase A-like enzyme